MKFTSEDLMKAMGLQVGDRIRLFEDKIREWDEAVYELVKNEQDDYPTYYSFVNIEDSDDRFNIHYFIDLEYEILPRPKRVGDLKCGFKKELGGIGSCTTCPVRIICGHYTCKDELGAGDTLYEYLETYKKKIKEEYDDEDEDYNDFDQEIYDLLKARLDKEVE